MCGVVSALAYGEFDTKKEEKTRQESMMFLLSELLQLTQSRGKDATGIATLFADCEYMGLKMGVSAQEFVARFGGTEKDYDGYLNIWRKKTVPAKIAIGHCRKPSSGVGAGADDNKNNHPIKVGDIIGVHNGTLTNYEKIFENLECGRDSNVDSEAIFRLLHHYTANGNEPFTTEGLLETCKRLDGTYACLAFSGNNPYQLAAFRDGKPLETCIIRPLKLLLLASDRDFLKAVVFRYNKMANLYQTGANKFSPLKKDDVDFEILSDDHLYLFDVHKDINTETKIKDLYITEKVPRTEKIWKKSSTTVWNRRNGNNLNNKSNASSNSSVKKTEVKAIPANHSTTNETTGKRLGMAWNISKNKYESVNAVNDTSAHGFVEMDVESGKVEDLTNGKVIEEGEKKMDTPNSSEEEKGLLLEESLKPVDDLITDPAKINEIAVAEIEKVQAADNAVSSKRETTNADIPKRRTEVDTNIYPDVIEKARIAVGEERNFHNDDELADAIEIESKITMRSMSLHSLANRVKSFFFYRGWYAGYTARLKEDNCFEHNELARNLLVRSRNKANKAKHTIRIMKTMVMIYDRIVGQSQNNITEEQKIDRAIVETLENGEDIRSSVIKKVFRDGDMMKSSMLRQITAAVTDKED